MLRRTLGLVLLLVGTGAAWARELGRAYVITAAANKHGLAGTNWHTDLTLYNPHNHALSVVVQLLPSDLDNSRGAPTAPLVEVQPWETVNLWDVLGPHGFDVEETTGALLVYADPDANRCPGSVTGSACDFAVFARNWTPNQLGPGEYGQAFPGFPADLGVDSSVIAYLPQLSDDGDFRTNVGVASWTSGRVTVRVDLQDAAGNLIDRRDHVVPPYGHVQWRLESSVTGGTAAAYILSGPAGAIVYPYATVVNWDTGDAVTVEAQISQVGLAAQSASTTGRVPRGVPARFPADAFSMEALRRRLK
jgi:hypothetical protein